MTTDGGTGSWQQHQRALRESAILDATATLMSERGFAATSLDDIAAAVGTSKPTLYQHFASKDAVAEAVVRRNLSQAEERLAAVEAAIEQGKRARPCLERHLHEAIDKHNALWATRAQVPTPVRDARPLRTRRERLWLRYGRIIDRCKADGDLRDDVPTPLMVRHIVRVFRGDYFDLIDNGVITLGDLATTLVSMLFDGLAPRVRIEATTSTTE